MSTTRDPHDELAVDRDAEAADAAKAEQLRRRVEVDDLKWLMAHAQGRRFVARLMAETGLFRTSFHTSGSLMALNEGRKQVGYWVQQELTTHTFDAYTKLLKEFSNG